MTLAIKDIHRRCRLIPALAMLLLRAVDCCGQGIVYAQFPITGGTTFTYDANGQRLWSVSPSFPQTADIVINGQVAYTFYSGTGFDIIPSSLNAVIAIQPGLPQTQAAFPVPLTAGQQIGPDAAGYTWTGNILGGDTLTAARDGGIIGQPPLTIGYFTGIESAYIGLQFQQDGQTYYGWARAGAPIAGINGGWIYDYAYETTPNTPILAGQGVPEPSVAALLSLSALTLLFRGRSKSQ